MRRHIRQATTRDGCRISYCCHGDGPPLVLVRGWISHLELMWDDPAFRGWVEALARRFTVIRYDARGNGLSDWDVAKWNLRALVSDLEAVVHDLGLERFVLYGQCFGGPIAISYTAHHPHPVERLILDGTYACGSKITTPEHRRKLLKTLRELPDAGMLLLSHYTNPHTGGARFSQPGGTPRAIRPEAAVRLYRLGFEVDVTHLLAEIRVPTLVLHRSHTLAVPPQLGRELASLMPNARFVELSGRPHNPWEGDAAEALAAVGTFLGVPLELASLPPDTGSSGALRILLFSDMVSSTHLLDSLGDRRARDLMRLHDDIFARELAGHGGIKIKHTGDGVLATFRSASRALACAIAIQRAFSTDAMRQIEPPVRVRIGVNAGEPEPTEEDLFGTVVHVTARLCALAGPGQILVPDAIRHLVAGKGFRFKDLGDVQLRGLQERLHLYELCWQ